MLGQMIAGGQALLRANPLAGSADFVVTSDAEWNAVFANSAATLAGKTVEIAAPSSAFTLRTISGKDMWAAGGRVTIRSRGPSHGIPALALSGTVRGIDFSGLNFQMTGWPHLHDACVYFDNGTIGKLRFLNGTTFRHGYGAGLANIDTTAQLPEYDRINNVRTATTTSASQALTWKDPAYNKADAWVEFFNRGSNSVRVAFGGAGVVADGTSALVAAGTRVRFTGLNPQTATHFAVLATTGTSEVNARTEIGLAAYLAGAFFSSGASTVEDIEIRNCLFRDLRDGVKGIGPQSIIVMDCDFDRIYQDIIAVTPAAGGSGYILRNLECLPFCRSGIAENLNGDARDPHGDQFQMFGAGSGTIGPVYYAGNRIRPGAQRAGIELSQGIFISDNDFTPSYENIFLISTMQVGGASNGITVGEAGFPARNLMIYGASVVDWRNPASTTPGIGFTTDQNSTVYVGSAIAWNAPVASPSGALIDGVLRLSTAASAAAVFPNIADLATATTRAEIEAAMTTAAEGAGLGAVATTNAINWTTSDHAAVIRWENIPSGVHWEPLVDQAANSVITLPLRKVFNRRAAQTVSVGAGTEWRSVASNGTTEVQAWTASPGTIEPDQFIQIRRTSGAAQATVAASVTINGFTESVNITSAVAGPAVFLIRPATLAHFGDTAVLPSGTTRLTWRGKFFFPTGTIANDQNLFSQVSDGCDLRTSGNGFILRVEDGDQVLRVGGSTVRLPGSFVADTWLDVLFDVDQVARSLTLTINGVTHTETWTGGTNLQFNTSRRIGLLATQAGAFPVAAGVRAADLSVHRNGTLYKAISNTAATANADAWKLGAGVFTNA